MNNFSEYPWGEKITRTKYLMEKLESQRYLTNAEIAEVQNLNNEIGNGFMHLIEATWDVFIGIGNVVQEVHAAIKEFNFDISKDNREVRNDTRPEPELEQKPYSD